MIKHVLSSFVAAVALLVCGSASAQLKYNFIEGGYAFTDIDDIGDGSGVRLGASFSPIRNVFIFGGGKWSSVDFDEIFENAEGDLLTGEIGAGLYFSLSQNFDIVGKAGWNFNEFDFDDIVDSVDSNGVEIEIGVRTLLGSQLELGAFVGWSDLEELDNDDVDFELGDVAVDLYGIFHVNPLLGIGVETTLQDNSSEIGAFLRLHF